ncbi:hypothetical protein [Bacillus inaquosorum]|uniref:hypothetical protein n=1 Tax=Bacillus inaquosorum TaxID=483913 RepID=UPI00228091F9|nr:hypothetical protein [Bacillus inaquosorum]MCY8137544.1 hypothetical protein [Bacillus inaquosorum]MED1542857.1 hypothetical protein [Bacillus inaquosorum]
MRIPRCFNCRHTSADPAVDFACPYTGRRSFLATIPASLLLAENGIPAFLHSSDALPPKYATSRSKNGA